jgi:hypothetical protein
VRQASLVALYGARHRGSRASCAAARIKFIKIYKSLLIRVYKSLKSELDFDPNALAQIHATVTGLERRTRSGFENRSFHAFRGCSKVMRIDAVVTASLA